METYPRCTVHGRNEVVGCKDCYYAETLMPEKKTYADECIERAVKATEGPWEYILDENWIDSNSGLVVNPSCGNLDKGHRITNGEFIAHSRVDVPELARRLKVSIAMNRTLIKRVQWGDPEELNTVNEHINQLEIVPEEK